MVLQAMPCWLHWGGRGLLAGGRDMGVDICNSRQPLAPLGKLSLLQPSLIMFLAVFILFVLFVFLLHSPCVLHMLPPTDLPSGLHRHWRVVHHRQQVP